jgi:PAS domain S-box-containing protein
MNTFRVVLADDHALVSAGIRVLLERLPGIEVVGEADNGPEALEKERGKPPRPERRWAVGTMRSWNRSRDTSTITKGWPCWTTRLRFALLMLASVSSGAVAQTAVEKPRSIRVVLDNDYAPYSFQSDEGKLEGILIDQWQAWEKKTGIKVEMNAADWGEALRRMRAGEFDVIDSIAATAERRDYFDFTPPYTNIEASIFFRSDISGITDLASLKGFPVGVKTGDQHIEQLKANGVTTVILFQNNDAIVEAAKQHKINVFLVDDPSALYLLNKMDIEAEFRHSAPIFRDELRRAVRKGDAAMLRTVLDGFAAIEPDEFRQIDEKWFGRTIDRLGSYLAYAGYAAAAAILLIAGLSAWNRTLSRKILQRTAALGESEQRFRGLVELMPVAVYVCDTSGIIQTYNHRAVELWGREPKSGDTAQLYCGSLRLYSPEGKLVPHEESKMAEVLRTGVEASDLEVVIERPDGSCITVLVYIAPLRNGDGELIGAMNCFQDITERKKVGEELGRYTHLLQILSRRLLEVQEEERRHLARELHDEVIQTLTAAKLNLKIIAPDVPPAVAGGLEDSIQLLDRLLTQVRQLSLDLRPPLLDELGLVPALRWLADQQAQRAGLRVTFTANVDRVEIDHALRTGCFRVAQEAITNAIRHARAVTVAVELRVEPDRVWLIVRDDGVGFDQGAMQQRAARGASIGLLSMKERASILGGELEVNSAPDRGTQIGAWFPLAGPRPDILPES